MTMHPSAFLDEISNDDLVQEIARRKSMRAQGKCDYCYRSYAVEPICKFGIRHSGKDNIVDSQEAHDEEQLKKADI